jgi:guanylate kinase
MMVKLKSLVGEATRVLLKPKEIGEGIPVTVHIDDEGYLILKDKEGKMIFLHPHQIQQLHKFLMKNKIKY